MRIDYIYKAVITAEHTSHYPKKNLNQEDRKLLLCCCRALENAKHVAYLKQKEIQIKKLIVRLEDHSSPPRARTGLCQRLCSIFKAIANALHLRIGSDRLDKVLHKTSDKIFPCSEMAITYKRLITTLLIYPLSAPQRHFALKTIESFYLLGAHKSFFVHHHDYILAHDYIKDKMGLMISREYDVDVVDLIIKAPTVLMNKWEEAVRNKRIKEFFEFAFNCSDKTFNERFHRIEDFNVENPDPLPKETKVVIEEEPIIIDKTPIDEAPIIIDRPPIDNYVEPIKDKFTTLLGACETFREIQMEKYADKFGLKNPHEKWFATKEKIIQKDDFLLNYANTDNFEEYIKNEYKEKIIGKKCVEGDFKPEDLPGFINSLVNVYGYLGINPAPIIFRPQIIQPQAQQDQPPIIQPQAQKQDQINQKKAKPDVPLTQEWKFPKVGTKYYNFNFSNQLKPNEQIDVLIAENKTNEYTESYKEILQELEKINRTGQYNAALETILGYYNFSLYYNEILAVTSRYPVLIKGIQNFDNLRLTRAYGEALTGIVIHTEYKGEVMAGTMASFPKYLLEAYELAKKKDCIVHFFENAFNNLNVCLDEKHETLVKWVLQQNAKDDLANSIVVPKMTILITETNQKNLSLLLEAFRDIKALEYAKKNNIVIDAKWSDEKGTKFIIVAKDDFKLTYNKLGFLAALRDIGIVGKKAKNDVFTQQEIDDFAEAVFND